MIKEKLESIKEELETVIEKEKVLTDALRQTQELKLKYLGAIEILQQIEEENKDQSAEKKKK